MNRRSLRLCGLMCFLVLLLSSAVTAVATSSYTEDFTSKEFCDTVNTTAWWDTTTGELDLHPFHLTLAGTYDTPGNAYAVAVAGDYAYVADNTDGLRVVDISDPENPVSAGSIDTPDAARGVTISGDYAYVADRAGGLQVIDISDPTLPSLAASFDTPWALQVAIAGNYAYIANDAADIYVVDITDPTNPDSVILYGVAGTVYALAVAGDYLYAASGGAGLHVVDITDPTNPSLAATRNTPGNAQGVVVSGNYAFVGDGSSGLQVIGISDPTNPTLEGNYATPGPARGVAVTGDYLYVADEDSGLFVLDISDPVNPTYLDSYDTPGTATSYVVLAGEYAFLTDGWYGLRTIDIAYAVDPTYAGGLDTPGTVFGVALSGNYAYVVDHRDGLLAIDISDPTSPALAGGFDISPYYPKGIALSGDYAYTADYLDSLHVIDISDPAHPAWAGSCRMPDEALDVALAGNYAYVAAGVAGLQVVDISDPASPDSVGSCSTAWYARDVALSGNHAYIACDLRFQVVDISDPSNPIPIGDYDTPGLASGVALDGDYLYVADWTSIQVIDISDPTNPIFTGSCDTPDGARSVTLDGDFAYVANEFAGLLVLDISDPANPDSVGRYDTPGYAFRVALGGDYAYVADGDSGLQVIKVLERRVNTEDDVAHSLVVCESGDTLHHVRLTTNQVGSITWEVSADNGSNWEDISDGDGFHHLLHPGMEFLWRADLIASPAQPDPVCTQLVIEWLDDHPEVDGVSDVANDQGRQARIRWLKSDYDGQGSSTPIVEYAVYRRVDEPAVSNLGPRAVLGAASSSAMTGEDRLGIMTYPPGDWDYVTAVPAYCEDYYSTVVPTLVDSTAAEGIQYSVFFVRAATATPGVYFDSPPDSGYSVDNLIPSPPSNFRFASPLELAWDPSPDHDFEHFTVYGSADPEFGEAAVLIGYTAETGMDISEVTYAHYHVTATDSSGNEGNASSLENTYAGLYQRPEDIPEVFALKQNSPNPFTAQTTIRFDMPGPCNAVITVFDVEGGLVTTLVTGAQSAGRHSMVWRGEDDTGGTVGSGIYFIRFEAGDHLETRKAILLK